MKLLVRGTISYPVLNLKRFSKKLKDTAETQQKQAVRAWLKAVIDKIPVYTGTSKGTFRPVGRYLNRAVTISPISNKKVFRYHGVTYPLGWELAGKYSKFKFTQRNISNGVEYGFLFINMLPYTVWNDMWPAPAWIQKYLTHPTPWEALDAGKIAWKNYVLTVLPGKLPKYARNVKIVKERVR